LAGELPEEAKRGRAENENARAQADQSPWLVLTIQAPSAERATMLTEGLFAAGATAVEERPDRVITYLQPERAQTPESYVAELAQQLRSFNSNVLPEIAWEWLPERDWSEEWKRGLGPRHVGKRLVIAPSWTEPEAGPGDLVITIDPQMAFGTGEHASTRGALRLLETCLTRGARVLDVGTGSAVLAIAAAMLGAERVLAVEADADSLINAQENIVRNGVADRIQLENVRVDDSYLRAFAGTRLDVILANILSGVIVPLLPALHTAIEPAGTLIIAGILQEEAAAVRAAAQAAGFTILREDREEGWWSAALAPAHPEVAEARPA
jgi:ribosomal protein L11 methyltransferase